ncbi:hypothetical protein M1563_03035 [Patescibacteria group bacterium]|nr:hypothetical protein [Patescibacteria group bacterium]MCL5409810.1 hypothetical protein [Patescibacteria group bacterium]
MNSYASGGVLGAAIYLPATSAMGLLLTDSSNPVVLFGFLGLCIVTLITTSAHIARFVINSKLD